jgi:hypothetical protein
MIGRLRIQLKESISIFAKMLQVIFSDKKMSVTTGSGAFKASKLEAALKKIVLDATGNENERMMDNQPDGDECKTYV